MMTKENNKQSISSEHSSAANVIVNNEGLLSEILVRVPAKSLIRFKCVSKQWLSLISDPQFAINHNRHNPSTLISGLYLNQPLGIKKPPIFVGLNGHLRYPTFDFLKDVREISDIYIIHACNGLMLCSLGTRYAVCNLATQKYVLLPEHGAASSKLPKNGLCGGCLAFDPLKSPNYKVVFLYSSVTSPREITSWKYSSEAASWKRICFTLPQLVYLHKVVFWNGAIHWVIRRNVHVKFEVDEEKVTETQMPQGSKILNDYVTEYLGECGGNLLFVRIRESAKGCKILEMDRYSNCWTLKCRVDLRPVISSFPVAHRALVLLCVLKRENGKDLELVMGVPDELISYNLKEKTLKVLCDSDRRPSTFYHYFSSFQVVESLSPV